MELGPMMRTMSAKYHRTFHLPFSPGGTSDDRRLDNVTSFLQVPVVITEKIDGSNLCMTRSDVFARSHSGAPAHPSFDMAKQIHGQVRHLIPEGLSVFGEWAFAVHSIKYSALPGYFCIFGVREDTTGLWWDWDSVMAMATELGMSTVPVLFEGVFTSAKEIETKIQELAKQPSACGGEREGVVIRLADSYRDPSISLAKFVRANHVQTDDHWTTKQVERNELAG